MLAVVAVVDDCVKPVVNFPRLSIVVAAGPPFGEGQWQLGIPLYLPDDVVISAMTHISPDGGERAGLGQSGAFVSRTGMIVTVHFLALSLGVDVVTGRRRGAGAGAGAAGAAAGAGADAAARGGACEGLRDQTVVRNRELQGFVAGFGHRHVAEVVLRAGDVAGGGSSNGEDGWLGLGLGLRSRGHGYGSHGPVGGPASGPASGPAGGPAGGSAGRPTGPVFTVLVAPIAEACSKIGETTQNGGEKPSGADVGHGLEIVAVVMRVDFGHALELRAAVERVDHRHAVPAANLDLGGLLRDC